MERESFEDFEIAALLRQAFISIKVDREERPDLDALYMEAVQMMTGAGGWPLSIFLTPDQVPFFGGTYFPPEDRWGRPGFKSLLTSIAEAWSGQREKLQEFADKLLLSLQQSSQSTRTSLDDQTLSRVATRFQSVFDRKYGGFGQAPKFPQPGILTLLLRHWQRTKDADSLSCVVQTLEAMNRGGIHDQLAGGFHRYSVDAQWKVPHFEKMLYDQAQLGLIYTQAFQVTGRPDFARVARDTYDFVLRDMTSPEGGFYAALDADSAGQEGTFYAWTPAQLKEALSPEHAEWAMDYWGVTPQGDLEQGGSVLHVTRPVLDEAPLEIIRTLLLRARNRREPPCRDEKVITAWNGMMIQALSVGGRILREPRYTQAAERAAHCVFDHLMVKGHLHRSLIDDHVGGPAYLDDYAWLMQGLLELYQTTLAVHWLAKAGLLAEIIRAKFSDPQGGAFFMTAADDESLLIRRKERIDGVCPSANAVLASAFIRWGRLSLNPHWLALAEGILQELSAGLADEWGSRFSAICAMDEFQGPEKTVVITGPWQAPTAHDMLELLYTTSYPGTVWLRGFTGQTDFDATTCIPDVVSHKPVDGRVTAYVCQDFVCHEPVFTAHDLQLRLALGHSQRLS